MKKGIKVILVPLGIVLLMFLMVGCGDFTDILVRDNLLRIDYYGWDSTLYTANERYLTVTNSTAANIFSIYFEYGIYTSDDLLEQYVIGRGNTNTIYGVPDENGTLNIAFSTNDSTPLSIAGADFTSTNHTLDVYPEGLLTNTAPGSSENSNGDPDATIIHQGGYVFIIK